MKLYFHICMFDGGTNTLNNVCWITACVMVHDKLCPYLSLNSVFQQVLHAAKSDHKWELDESHVDLYTGKKKLVCRSKLVCSIKGGSEFYAHICHNTSATQAMFKKHNCVEVVGIDKNLIVANEDILAKAENFVVCKREDLALEVCKSVLEIHPKFAKCLKLASDILMKASQYRKALPYLRCLVEMDPRNVDAVCSLSEAMAYSVSPSSAVEFLSSSSRKEMVMAKGFSSILRYKLMCAFGFALEMQGSIKAASEMYLSCARESENKYIDALVGYATMAQQYGQISLKNIFIILLNALGKTTWDERLQKLFSVVLNNDDAFNCLVEELGEAWSDFSSLMTLAAYLRKVGCVKYCLKVLERAAWLSNGDVGITLSIIHVHEDLRMFKEALQHITQFLSDHPHLSTVRNVELLPIIKLVQPKLSHLHSGCPFDFELNRLSIVQHDLPQNLDDDELRLMAIYFTLVKMLFLEGFLDLLPTVLQRLSPFLRCEELHRTLIRNEQAYFKCIYKVMDLHPPTAITHKRFIYVIGDSHTLPIAWRSISLNGDFFSFCPMLVTGLKIWHLRSESLFYTKISYNLAIERVPKNSIVLFVLGEIDCREGISRAVHKCWYDSVEEAIAYLVQIYISVLCRVRDEKQCRIFVHPVPPVLKKSQIYTFLFNEALESKLRAVTDISFLNFAADLVDDGMEIRKEYVFDDVHLHPSYTNILCSYIADALN